MTVVRIAGPPQKGDGQVGVLDHTVAVEVHDAQCRAATTLARVTNRLELCGGPFEVLRNADTVLMHEPKIEAAHGSTQIASPLKQRDRDNSVRADLYATLVHHTEIVACVRLAAVAVLLIAPRPARQSGGGISAVT